MTKLERYPSFTDAQMRLNHSYLRYKGEPCYVANINENKLLTIVTRKDTISVSAEDEELDLTSPPTGYCVDRASYGTFWTSRYPYRQQKQGLEHHCVQVYQEREDFRIAPTNTPFTKHDIIFDMIEGKYDPFEKAVAKVLSNSLSYKWNAFPWSRNFCLCRITDAKSTLGIKFMGRGIGLFDANSKTAFISHKYGNSPVSMELARVATVEVEKTSDDES